MDRLGIKTEREQAEKVSAAIDLLLAGLEVQPDQVEPGDAGLLDTARYLTGLVQRLGPVGPALERRQGAFRPSGRPLRGAWLPRLRPAWVMAALAALLLAVALLTPLGHTALAGFMAVFNLGRTEVRITPAHLTSTATAVAGSTAIVGDLTLEQAQAQVCFAIPQPANLPPGYRLFRVQSYTYPDLPAWIPQPFCIELVYDDDQGHQAALRLYPIALGDRASISRLNLEATPIQDVRDVDVSGKPGVLLRLGAQGAEAIWQELVWEQGDLILALSSATLTEDELMRMARSVR
ncbi:MAG: hypothetical protein JXM73_16590 [Anaerolineae bacterium]|nr:hypothetical protein [Anaerolineae bacterium]